ncbi:MAG: YaiI/YqxD family protein [Spirochaetaceae bacterium]|nr:MAG: YaiI/YqxD family protein [Spirochaetaceae bacterium]
MITVWIDADNCVREAREFVERAACRGRVRAVFVADRPIRTADSPQIQRVLVAPGDQQSDRVIQEQVQPGDIVVTRDIPLAAELVEQGIVVLNDRGTVWSSENVRERLSMRDFKEEMREQGLAPKRMQRYDKRDAAAFVAALDREITRATAKQGGGA